MSTESSAKNIQVVLQQLKTIRENLEKEGKLLEGAANTSVYWVNHVARNIKQLGSFVGLHETEFGKMLLFNITSEATIQNACRSLATSIQEVKTLMKKEETTGLENLTEVFNSEEFRQLRKRAEKAWAEIDEINKKTKEILDKKLGPWDWNSIDDM